MKSQWKTYLAAGALLLAPLVAGAAESPDAWITTKTKVAVLTSVGVAGTDINVDTVEGLVTLHGTVENAADKAKAGKAARRVTGVKKVRNLLEVVSPKQESSVTASDADLERSAAAAIHDDEALKEDSVKVKSVHKGTVLLSGSTKSLANQLRAVEDVRHVPGVRRVASEIVSPDSKEARTALIRSETKSK